mmetsp:Transcript_17411/g.31383  ORF Transcript_17411/g.31383 Transcript_17411/m.31383 type:complete len:213 (+) Transcript_17411:51-689(+)
MGNFASDECCVPDQPNCFRTPCGTVCSANWERIIASELRIDGRSPRLEELLQQLFSLHDLNQNGVLEEVELVKLNEKIAILHHGRDTDRGEIRRRYSGLFRNRLDSDGQPVEYPRFRQYMLQILDELDRDALTQEMIAEQLVAEADLAISAFPASLKTRSGILSSLATAASSPEPLRSPVQLRTKAREIPGELMDEGWLTTRPERLAARGGG